MDKDRNREAGSVPKPAEGGQERGQEYQFLSQIIRKKPADRRTLALRVMSVVFGAALFGIVAALFFIMSMRIAGGASAFGGDNPKISLAADEESAKSSEMTAPGEPPSAPAAEEAEETPPTAELPVLMEFQETPDSQAGDLQGSAAGGLLPDSFSDTTEPETALTLQTYRTLIRNMMGAADEPERSIVSVTGIRSEMDFFNRNYENASRLSGLAVAENDKYLFVLTEYRVVKNVERILLTFYDGTMADADFQKQDPGTGLAILKVPLDSIREETRKNLQTAPLGNSEAVSRGEPILVLGSPMGYADSVASGVITSVSNVVSGVDAQHLLLTTDVEGSQNGSGVLVNLDGQVIGIVAQRYNAGDNHTITALAISQLKPLIEKLSNNETLPWIGVTGQTVTQELSEQTGIPAGMLVTGVEQDSPAMLAGIKEYDVITGVGSHPVSDADDYQDIVSRLAPEEKVEITAMRKGAEDYSEISFSAECGGR